MSVGLQSHSSRSVLRDCSLVARDAAGHMAIQKGLGSDEESSTKPHLFDLNATPGLESQRPLPNEKSTHYLSLVKPQMVQQALSFRGSCKKRKALCLSSHDHTKRCGEGKSMELFPLHPDLATKEFVTCRESAHQLQGLSLLTPFQAEGLQSPASRSPPPATNPHKQPLTQLTIFYKGTVNAYNVPAEKAEDIMNMLAGKGDSHRLDCDSNIEQHETYTATSSSSGSVSLPIWKAVSADDQNETSIALPFPTERATGGGIQQIDKLRGADLPLARKQSLQRFFEKRQIKYC